MRIAPRDIERFINNPNNQARVILVYGPDSGLMKERVKKISHKIISDINAPFNSAVLDSDAIKDDPARLIDEASAMSMMGGDRLIRVENAGDKITTVIKTYLEAPSTQNLVVLEAGELGPRSSLRKLCESDKNAAALPCYIEDERDLLPFIQQTIRENNLTINQAAAVWLASNIFGDRLRVRGELEKLITYIGQEGQEITLEDVQACCGEAGAETLDRLIYSTASGKTDLALKSYNILLGEGTPIIVILRSLQNHFRRIHYIKSLIKQGETPDAALKKLYPPVFYKQADGFKSQTRKWDMESLATTLCRLNELEADCKKTGMPDTTLCGQALLSISMKAARLRG